MSGRRSSMATLPRNSRRRPAQRMPPEGAPMTFAPHLHAPEASRFPAFNGGLRDLFSTLDDLLTCGGDIRLMLDPTTRLNDYGCGPSPSPQAWSFASCTASVISERAYGRAGLAREELMRSAIAVGLEDAL